MSLTTKVTIRTTTSTPINCISNLEMLGCKSIGCPTADEIKTIYKWADEFSEAYQVKLNKTN